MEISFVKMLSLMLWQYWFLVGWVTGILLLGTWYLVSACVRLSCHYCIKMAAQIEVGISENKDISLRNFA